MKPFFGEGQETEVHAGSVRAAFPTSPPARPTRPRLSLPAAAPVWLDDTFSPERLPRHSPYVGTFHHGFKATNSDVPTFDFDLEKLSPKNPHVGTFKHSAREKVRMVQRKNSLEATPLVIPSSAASQRSTFGEENVRRQSFKDIGDWLKSPELCGLQAMVPKGCGIRIMDKVGEGGFAKVVMAMNHRNKDTWQSPVTFRTMNCMPKEGQHLVLKAVKKECTLNALDMDCLAREVVIHGRCRHPNIPLLYGYYEDKSHVFMVLEYIEGKELRQMMSERRTIPEDESLLIYLQMMRALEYIHAQGYIHRDVKPQNVMVKPSGRALIIDFGLSIDSEQGPSEHEEGAGVGTMGFFAPEMVKSNHISAKQDVWASGVILYEMVFGFVPFLPHDLLSDDGVEFPEACWGLEASPALQDVLTKVLCKTHAGRPSSWEALQLAWFTPGAATAVDALIAMEESVAGARFDERAASWDESRRVAFEALSYRVAEQGHLSVTTRTIAISTPQVRPGYYFDAGQPPPFMRDMSDSTVG